MEVADALLSAVHKGPADVATGSWLPLLEKCFFDKFHNLSPPIEKVLPGFTEIPAISRRALLSAVFAELIDAGCPSYEVSIVGAPQIVLDGCGETNTSTSTATRIGAQNGPAVHEHDEWRGMVTYFGSQIE